MNHEELLLNHSILKERAKNCTDAPYTTVLENIEWTSKAQLSKILKDCTLVKIDEGLRKDIAEIAGSLYHADQIIKLIIGITQE